MEVVVSLYSNEKKEIKYFLDEFYNSNIKIDNDLIWDCTFRNPTESADIIGTFIDNKDKFNINMWVSLDKGFFINVTEQNADKIIRYLFERYPY